jgi:hypothetical protein
MARAEQGLAPEHKTKCGHQGCACMVEPSQSYCSEYCARETKGAGSANLPGGTHQDSGCRCGHPECEHA